MLPLQFKVEYWESNDRVHRASLRQVSAAPRGGPANKDRGACRLHQLPALQAVCRRGIQAVIS